MTPRIALPRLVVLAIAVAVAGCGGATQGFDRAPASLDPASPTIAAEDVAFDRTELAVPADEPFILVFENRESIAHNVAIYADAAFQDRRFEGAIFGGPSTRWYPVAALAPGRYVFVCDLHRSMRGIVVAA